MVFIDLGKAYHKAPREVLLQPRSVTMAYIWPIMAMHDEKRPILEHWEVIRALIFCHRKVLRLLNLVQVRLWLYWLQAERRRFRCVLTMHSRFV